MSSSSGSLTQQLERIFHALANPPPWQPPTATPSSSSDVAAPPPDAALTLITRIAEAQKLASSLNLISSNDELRDVQTGTLRALLLPSALAEALNRVRTSPNELDKRRENLERSRDALKTYLLSLLQLHILPTPSNTAVGLGLLSAQARAHLSSTGPPTLDAASRRTLKIALLQLERSIVRALDTYREAARMAAKMRSRGGLRAQKEGIETAAEGQDALALMPEEAAFDLLVLPRKGAQGGVNNSSDEEDESDREDDEETLASSSSSSTAGGAIEVPKTLRAYLLLLLALHASKAIASLDSIRQEVEILKSMAGAASHRAEGERERAREEVGGGAKGGEEWRLDRRFDAGAAGPLMDKGGKVLRPFQITSSGSTAAAGAGAGASAMGTLADNGMDARRKIREGVFKPSHRLPSMSIDEFLEEEERRGNVIRGGGPEGAAKATPREARALRAEKDGTYEAEEAQEEARREAIEWDAFTEANPKGAGNTMNRG